VITQPFFIALDFSYYFTVAHANRKLTACSISMYHLQSSFQPKLNLLSLPSHKVTT